MYCNDLSGDECRTSFWLNFLKLSLDFLYEFILVFMQKSIPSWDLFFLLESLQYLSKMPYIGGFSIISSLQNVHVQIEKNIIMFWKAIFYFIPYMFPNQLRGQQQDSKLRIKLHMSSKYISPHFFCGILLNFETRSVWFQKKVFDRIFCNKLNL